MNSPLRLAPFRSAAKFLLLATCSACPPAFAADEPPRARIVIMGDAEFFNIGQDGYCGKRAIVDSPASKTFLLPSGKTTWFRMSSKLRVPTATYSCSGEYSFVPVAGKLHILRYSVIADGCLFEHFMSEPSGTPAPAPIQQEEPRSCLLQ